MASTLVFANCYSENRVIGIRDYSENINTSNASANLSTSPDGASYRMVFNGTNAYYTIPNSTDYTAGDITICIRAIIQTGADGTILSATNSVSGYDAFAIKYNNSTGSVEVLIEDNAGVRTTLTVASAIDTTDGYTIIKNIVYTYKQSTTTHTLYVNDISSTDSAVVTPETIDSDFIVGRNPSSADYFNDELMDIRMYSSLASNTFIANFLTDKNTGCGVFIAMPQYTDSTGNVNPSASFEVLDLLLSSGEKKAQLCVTAISDTEGVFCLPFNDIGIVAGQTLNRIGNRYNSTRQYCITSRPSDEEILIHNRVTTFSGFDAGSFVTTKITKNGIFNVGLTKTANYTLKDFDTIIYADTSGGAFTLTLPSSPLTNKEYTIIDSVGSFTANNLTINGNGNNINGHTTAKMVSDYESWQLIFNGTQWNLK